MKSFSYREIISITAPIMLGTFVQSIVTFTDAIFVSKLGEVSIGAFGNGSLMYVSLFMLSKGLADGTQIIIARQNGEGSQIKIGTTLLNAQAFQFILSTFFFLFLYFFSQGIINALSESKSIAHSMYDFISVRGWGLFFSAQHITLVAFFIGLGKTRIILYSALLIAVCNIVLDYALISGNLGMPSLGLIGAPLASTISELVGFLFLLIYLLKTHQFKQYDYRLIRLNFNLKKHLNILKLSYPLMIQGLLSISTWLVFFTLIEHMGTTALESAHNMRYMYFLAFVPILGFGATTKTIVSNLLGQGKLHLAPQALKRTILLSVSFLIVVFHGAILYPEVLIGLVDHNPVISPQVLSDSVAILRFVSGSVLIFAIAVVFYNSISGLGKTPITLAIEVIAIVIYLIGCYVLIVSWQVTIRQVWWVEYMYFITIGILSFSYLLYYRKKIIYE